MARTAASLPQLSPCLAACSLRASDGDGRRLISHAPPSPPCRCSSMALHGRALPPAIPLRTRHVQAAGSTPAPRRPDIFRSCVPTPLHRLPRAPIACKAELSKNAVKAQLGLANARHLLMSPPERLSKVRPAMAAYRRLTDKLLPKGPLLPASAMAIAGCMRRLRRRLHCVRACTVPKKEAGGEGIPLVVAEDCKF